MMDDIPQSNDSTGTNTINNSNSNSNSNSTTIDSQSLFNQQTTSLTGSFSQTSISNSNNSAVITDSNMNKSAIIPNNNSSTSTSTSTSTGSKSTAPRLVIKLTHHLMDTYNAINDKYYANKKKRAAEAAAAKAAQLAQQQQQQQQSQQQQPINNNTTAASLLTKPILYNDGYDDKDYNYIVRQHEQLNNRYLVEHSLGKGSFGRVIKCTDILTGRHVAVKIVKSKSAFYKQAQIEMKILQSLQSDNEKWNIVSMLDAFMHRSHQCIVFELLSINLYDLLRNTRFAGVSLNLIAKFAHQLLCTLGYLSSPERGDKKIIHCDLKPENILLVNCKRSLIKTIDFGSACFSNQKAYTYIQSRFYRAPEVLLQLPYSCAIDMWSLGCILVELHTGKPLFDGTDEADQLVKQIEVLGMPPAEMLEGNKKAEKYMEKDNNSDIDPITGELIGTGSGEWRLKKKYRCRKFSSLRLALGSKYVCNVMYEQFLDLVSQMLIYNPKHRIKPTAAINHAFFQILNSNNTATANNTTATAATPTMAESISVTGSTPLTPNSITVASVSASASASAPVPPADISMDPHQYNHNPSHSGATPATANSSTTNLTAVNNNHLIHSHTQPLPQSITVPILSQSQSQSQQTIIHTQTIIQQTISTSIANNNSNMMDTSITPLSSPSATALQIPIQHQQQQHSQQQHQQQQQAHYQYPSIDSQTSSNSIPLNLYRESGFNQSQLQLQSQLSTNTIQPPDQSIQSAATSTATTTASVTDSEFAAPNPKKRPHSNPLHIPSFALVNAQQQTNNNNNNQQQQQQQQQSIPIQNPSQPVVQSSQSNLHSYPNSHYNTAPIRRASASLNKDTTQPKHGSLGRNQSIGLSVFDSPNSVSRSSSQQLTANTTDTDSEFDCSTGDNINSNNSNSTTHGQLHGHNSIPSTDSNSTYQYSPQSTVNSATLTARLNANQSISSTSSSNNSSSRSSPTSALLLANNTNTDSMTALALARRRSRKASDIAPQSIPQSILQQQQQQQLHQQQQQSSINDLDPSAARAQLQRMTLTGPTDSESAAVGGVGGVSGEDFIGRRTRSHLSKV